MNRHVGGVVLGLLGAALLRISATDLYLNYVKASMRPWLLLTGAVLLALGIWTLVDVVRSAARPDGGAAPPAPTDDDTGVRDAAHDHAEHGLPRTAWLLLLPVLAVVLVAPPPLGGYAAEREAPTVLPPAEQSDLPPIPPGDPSVLALSDFAVRAVWDDGRTLAGKPVALTGFASAAPGGGWYLTRLALTCCAADAVATKVMVVDPPFAPTTNTWVTVVGQWTPGGGTQSVTAVPRIKADSMTVVPQPTYTYE